MSTDSLRTASGAGRLSPLWAFAFGVFGCAATGAESVAPVGLEAFGLLPSIEHVALSSDGRRLAFIRAIDGLQEVDVYDLEERKLAGRAGLGATLVRAIEWADGRHLLITAASSDMPFGVSGERQEFHLIQSWEVGTNHFQTLLGGVHEDHVMNVVYGRPTIVRGGSGTEVFAQGIHLSPDGGEQILVRSDLDGARESIVRTGSRATREWLVNDRGEIVAQEDYVEREHRWVIAIFKDRRVVQTAGGVAALDQPRLLGLNGDSTAAVVAMKRDDGYHWVELSLADGTWGRELAPRVSRAVPVFDPGSRRIIGAASLGDGTRYDFPDSGLQNNWDWVERLFSGERVELSGMSADHGIFLVQVFGPKHGYAYYIADTKERLNRQVGAIYDRVPRIAEVRPIHYPAADGLEIPAYLTLPPDRGERGLPLVVLPHGGPQAEDRLGFDWWAQALAAQGYAVLQPNYRGSSLDLPWVEKGYGEWGRRMQTDLSDGVHWLAGRGLIDPSRVCIVGASYGGYAAMAGVTLQHGIYRCAVAVAGVSDLAAMLRWVQRAQDARDSEVSRYWDRYMGASGPDDMRLVEISPVAHAADAEAPLMLIHGKDDTTVPYDQSERMAKALRKLGKPVDLVTLKKEDHYLSRSETRLQMLTESVAFLRRNNPPD